MRLIVLLLSLFLAGGVGAQTPSQQVPEPGTQQNIKDQQQRAATQPGNNAPFYREVRGGPQTPYTTSSAQGRETGVLIQSWGDTWRRIRNGPVTFYGGWLLVLTIAAMLGLYLWKGPVRLREPETGRLMRRFTPFEMVVHWSAAISFCILGLSGLTMLFGKHVLLPIIGYTLFAWLTELGKNLHNFIAPLFIVSVSVMVFMWAKDNLWKSYDWKWLTHMWSFFMSNDHVPSGRFNAMEKVWFWGFVLLLSVVMAWSGLILLFPNFDQTRATMQEAWIFHAVAAICYLAMGLGHIYMGTIGVEGAYRNMRHGVTDETWAKEHHEIWYEEVKSGRRAEVPGGPVPAGAPHMKEKS